MNTARHRQLAIVSLCLLPLLWLWPCVFGGRTFVPYDTAQFPPVSLLATPDQLAAARDGANFDVTEVPPWFLPELILARDELRAGRAPTWDPNARAGAPLHAHGLIGLCYPPNWIALFADDPASRLVFVAWVNLALGGLLAFGLLRTTGCGLLAAWFGATLFQLSGPMAANAFFWMRLASFVWLPGVLWAVLATANAERLRARHTAALAGAFAATWLAGFPPFAATTTVLAAMFAGWLVVARMREHGARAAAGLGLRLGLGFVLGALLAMPQVLPSLRFFPHSARETTPSTEAIAGQAFETYGLIGYLLPDALGHPGAVQEVPYRAQNPLGLLWNTRTAAGKAALPNFNFTEYSVFTGQLGLLLALIGAVCSWGAVCGRGRHRGFALAALLGCAGLALYLPGFRLLFHLPVVQNVWPMRWLAPATLFVAWLAALGLERLLAGTPRVCFAAGGAAALLALLAALLCPLPARWHAADHAWAVQRLAAKYETSVDNVIGHVQDGSPGIDRFAAAFSRLETAGVNAAWWLSASAVLLLLFALRSPRLRITLAVAAGVLSALQLGFHGASVTRGSANTTPIDTPVHQFLRERAHDAAGAGGFTIVRASRVPALQTQLPPGQLMVPGIRDLHFYSHFDGRSAQPIEQLLGPRWGPATAAKGYLTLSLPDVLPVPGETPASPYPFVSPLEHPLLDLLGVRFVLATEPLAHAGTRVGPLLRGPGGEFFVYERPHPLPRAFTVPGLRSFANDADVVRALVDPGLATRASACVLATDLSHPDVPDAGQPVADAAPRTVTFVTDHPTVVELDIGAGAAPWLVLADTWLPGWTATVDGVDTPLRRCNHSQRLVRLPATSCRVCFVYEAPGLAQGLWLAGIAAFALLCLGAFLRQRNRAGTTN